MRWTAWACVTALASGMFAAPSAAPAQSGPDARADWPDARTDASPPAAPGITPAEALRLRALAFSRFRKPLRASAQAVGAYANGCVLGAAALPASGTNFEVLHLQRSRNFGHPALLAYIRRLATAAKKQGVGPLLIGDLSQPRGGPTPSGHRSHQSGLDVDIGFTRQPFFLKRRPNAKEREELMPPVVFDLKARVMTAAYGPKVERLIELAARDSSVERVFVNPHIKAALCKKKLKDRSWLRVVRPWAYHHDHLHARLKCPLGSPECEAQAEVAPGDGCDEVERWIADEERRLREPPRPPPPPPTEPRVPRPPPPLPPMPVACQALIDEGAAPPVANRGMGGRTAREP